MDNGKSSKRKEGLANPASDPASSQFEIDEFFQSQGDRRLSSGFRIYRGTLTFEYVRVW